MAEMGKIETNERFNDGLAQAISRARELAKKQKNPFFNSIAIALEGIKQNGMTLANAKSLSKSQILRDIKGYENKLKAENPQ